MQAISHALPTPMLADGLTENSSSQSIEEKIKTLYAQYTTEVKNRKEALIHQSNTMDISNPIELMNMQNAIGKYSLELNLVSTLTHKTTSAIDTLLKAQ
ncbi:type III secretion system inner rod subunit SctI [Providencia manganoxydans]|uniref:type III secretion system inner rod subunit SctI n=1 Tax=Providencia manganoxydans TaxID=2923283 RepID=UPI0032DA3FB2